MNTSVTHGVRNLIITWNYCYLWL